MLQSIFCNVRDLEGIQAATDDMRHHSHIDAGGCGPLFRYIARKRSDAEASSLGVPNLARSLIVGPRLRT
jgi:hypothetical protein